MSPAKAWWRLRYSRRDDWQKGILTALRAAAGGAVRA